MRAKLQATGRTSNSSWVRTPEPYTASVAGKERSKVYAFQQSCWEPPEELARRLQGGVGNETELWEWFCTMFCTLHLYLGIEKAFWDDTWCSALLECCFKPFVICCPPGLV